MSCKPLKYNALHTKKAGLTRNKENCLPKIVFLRALCVSAPRVFSSFGLNGSHATYCTTMTFNDSPDGLDARAMAAAVWHNGKV